MENCTFRTMCIDTAKSLLYSCLKIETPGLGYCHFLMNDMLDIYSADLDYFQQLTIIV